MIESPIGGIDVLSLFLGGKVPRSGDGSYLYEDKGKDSKIVSVGVVI
jgi:hypothetical protein